MEPREVEVPMLDVKGEKPEVAAEKKNQYLATIAGKKNSKRKYRIYSFYSCLYCIFH